MATLAERRAALRIEREARRAAAAAPGERQRVDLAAIKDPTNRRIAAYFNDASDEAFSLTALAGVIGVTRQAVSRRARGLGLVRKCLRKHTPASRAAISEGLAKRRAKLLERKAAQ